jgi:hypothetical protein
MTRCLAAPPGEQLGVFQLFVGERVIGLRSQSSHKRVAGLPIASEPSRHSGEIISWPESIRCLASRVVMEIYRVGPHLVAQIRSTGQGHHQHARSTTSGSCSGENLRRFLVSIGPLPGRYRLYLGCALFPGKSTTTRLAFNAAARSRPGTSARADPPPMRRAGVARGGGG